MTRTGPPDIDAVRGYLAELQDRICRAFEGVEPRARFREDRASAPSGGLARTRALEDGAVLERAAVNFTHARGEAVHDDVRAVGGGETFDLEEHAAIIVMVLILVSIQALNKGGVS